MMAYCSRTHVDAKVEAMERVLRETPSRYPGALAWSQENLLAVGQEHSVLILVRNTRCSSLGFPRCLCVVWLLRNGEGESSEGGGAESLLPLLEEPASCAKRRRILRIALSSLDALGTPTLTSTFRFFSPFIFSRCICSVKRNGKRCRLLSLWGPPILPLRLLLCRLAAHTLQPGRTLCLP